MEQDTPRKRKAHDWEDTEQPSTEVKKKKKKKMKIEEDSAVAEERIQDSRDEESTPPRKVRTCISEDIEAGPADSYPSMSSAKPKKKAKAGTQSQLSATVVDHETQQMRDSSADVLKQESAGDDQETASTLTKSKKKKNKDVRVDVASQDADEPTDNVDKRGECKNKEEKKKKKRTSNENQSEEKAEEGTICGAEVLEVSNGGEREKKEKIRKKKIVVLSNEYVSAEHEKQVEGELEIKAEKKKKKKKKKGPADQPVEVICEDVEVENNQSEGVETKKNDRSKKDTEALCEDAKVENNQAEGGECKKKKKKKKKRKNKDYEKTEEGEDVEAPEDSMQHMSKRERKELHRNITAEDAGSNLTPGRHGKTVKKVTKYQDLLSQNVSDRTQQNSNIQTSGDNMKVNKKKKKVSFQDQVIDENKSSDEEDDTSDDGIMKNIEEEIWGKRFTRKENEILKTAVFDYIKRKGWSEKEGLEKVLNCKKNKEAYDCWSEIGTCLPNRPRNAIRYRAHLMLEQGTHLGRWTKEESEHLKRLYQQHGRKWKEFASLLGRSRSCIKEKWRSLKRPAATGVWKQEELQQLSDLVHKCFRLKALTGIKKPKNDRHILRDDLSWEKIADDIGTHSHGSCASKWYYHLASSMVKDGLWANEDDFLLLKSLLESGACAEEEVDWDALLDHRSGQVCLMRWKQMSKYLGENRTKVFLDKLDILARRYAPELLENSLSGTLTAVNDSDEPIVSSGNSEGNKTATTNF